MIQHIVTEIGGIAGFGVISICLFFATFGGVLIYAFCQKKPFLTSMGNLPLHDGEKAGDEKGQSHD